MSLRAKSKLARITLLICIASFVGAACSMRPESNQRTSAPLTAHASINGTSQRIGITFSPRRVDAGSIPVTSVERDVQQSPLRLLYAVASNGQPETPVVANGIVYGAEASTPDPLVSWRLADGSGAQSIVFDTEGLSNTAPLVSNDGQFIVTAHTSGDSEVTVSISELPDMTVRCSAIISGAAIVEGFTGMQIAHGHQITWYRGGENLYGIRLDDCTVTYDIPLAPFGALIDFVVPTIAPDGTLWASYRNSGTSDAVAEVAQLIHLNVEDVPTVLCVAPVGDRAEGYGTPVVAWDVGATPDNYSIFMAGNDGVVARIESDCQISWSRQVLPPRGGVEASGLVHQGPAVSTALGLIFVGDNSGWSDGLPPSPTAGSVIALDLKTGQEVWRWRDGARLQAFAPFLVGDVLFVRTYNGTESPPRLTALDAASGREIDSLDLFPPSESGKGSGPISAKLLCTSGACIVASALGQTSELGWWFVIAFNDLVPDLKESVPFSGNDWHQNAYEPRLERAGYYANGAIIWRRDGSYSYEHTPLGTRFVDRDRISARGQNADVALRIESWSNSAAQFSVSPVGAEVGAEDVVRLEIRHDVAGATYALERVDAPGSRRLSAQADDQGTVRFTLGLREATRFRLTRLDEEKP